MAGTGGSGTAPSTSLPAEQARLGSGAPTLACSGRSFSHRKAADSRMKSSHTVRRSLAETLTRLAAGVFPLDRQEWSAAMRAELYHIGDDGEALRWAIGCLRTGLLQRCRLGALLDLRIVRWFVAA